MADFADPVTNPLGYLSTLQQRQAEGFDAQQAQLSRLKEAADRAPEEDANERWASMALAASKHPPVVGGFGQLLASIGGAYGQTLSQQEERNFQRQAAIAKLMDQGVGGIGQGSMTAITQAMLNPYVNVPGIGYVRKSDAQVQIPSNMVPEYNKLYSAFYKTAVDQKMPNPEEWAARQARAQLGGVLQTSTIAGGRTTAAPAPAEGDQVDLAPGTDVNKLLEQLSRDEKEAVALGDYAKAMEVKRARTAIQAQQPAAPTGLQYKNVPAEKARETTATKSAEIYAKRFDEDVVTPAASFSDTSRIMQDFNNLAQMQAALKNGKLKEFMAGETGKWLLPMLPADSKLRQGIANAQEAEKLTAGMVNKILLAAKGVQTEGDAQRARSQVTSIGTDPDANKYLEAYITETARQLKAREQLGLSHKESTGTFEGYDKAWQNSPIMQAKGSVKKIGTQWIGVSQYMDKIKQKYPEMSDADAVASWNKVK